jgi:hypothetical protein
MTSARAPGKALLIAEREFGARATGFEISILPYCIAKINLFLGRAKKEKTRPGGASAKIIFKNFFEQDLHDADVIFCFLFPPIMHKVEHKLRNELKPGARVVVYAFPLSTMAPTQTIIVCGKWKMFVYRTD